MLRRIDEQMKKNVYENIQEKSQPYQYEEYVMAFENNYLISK